MKKQELIFLKLGGSLITDKSLPHTPRLDVLDRLAGEIAAALEGSPRGDPPAASLLLGHGSGSFAHVPAKKYGTRQGVRTQEEWRGFVEVWKEAAGLNRLVIDSLQRAGLPALAFPPSAMILARSGAVETWNTDPIEKALAAGLLPVVYGDVIFDLDWGGTIFSTEELFVHLAQKLHPARLLIAGIEPGVWADFPTCTRLIPRITPANIEEITAQLGGSASTDVTGGMAAKVRTMLELVRGIPGLQVRIFSGLEPGNIEKAIFGEPIGTEILAW